MTVSPRLLYLVWTALIAVGGSLLMGFHQPFRAPTDRILTLVGDSQPGHWRAVHFLSPSCACSQRVLEHLAARGPLPNISEQVVMISGPEPALPNSDTNLQRVAARGFSVRRLDASAIPADIGLVGVPLLIAVSPEDRLAYRGGYGEHGDQDTIVLQQARAGLTPRPLPMLGCAIGQHLRERLDPMHVKYTGAPSPQTAAHPTLSSALLTSRTIQ